MSNAGLLVGQWKNERLEIGPRGGILGGDDRTYHFGWNTHALELLLVIRSGFGAVIRNEDDLFAWCSLWSDARDEEIVSHSIPLLRSISNVSTVPSKRWSPDHRTPIFFSIEPYFPGLIPKDCLPLSSHLQPIDSEGTHHHSRTGTPG